MITPKFLDDRVRLQSIANLRIDFRDHFRKFRVFVTWPHRSQGPKQLLSRSWGNANRFSWQRPDWGPCAKSHARTPCLCMRSTAAPHWSCQTHARMNGSLKIHSFWGDPTSDLMWGFFWKPNRAFQLDSLCDGTGPQQLFAQSYL